MFTEEYMQVETEIERLRKKVENFPSASLYNRLAELVRQAGDEVGAEVVCRRCTKEFPRSGQAYVILAELKSAQNKKAEAIYLLQQGLEKDPRSYAAHRLMADLADSREVTLHHLRQILSFKPNDPATVQRITELGGDISAASTTVMHRPANHSHAGTSSDASSSGASTSGRSDIAGPVAVPPPLPLRDSNAPLAFPSMPTSASTPMGTVPTLLRSIGAVKTAILDPICSELGVRGACIVDVQGRVMMSKNLPAGQDELLAALSADILKSATATLKTHGASAPATWVVVAAGGQVLTFSRDHAVSVVVMADPGVRPAMLELRARQALIELGAS
jgi:predicted regulator of Ras-like GTPase activity (Roadblock/LC7/MglB family)